VSTLDVQVHTDFNIRLQTGCDLFVGDSANILKTLPDNYIDLTVTSPPYDNLRAYKGFTFDFETIAQELYRVTKPGGVLVWIVADATVKGSETGTSFKQALYFKECGFNLHDTMIWDKGSFTATGSLKVRYASYFEYMFVLSKGSPKSFHPIKDRLNKRAGTKQHGTVRNTDGSMKPISNPGRLIAEFGQRSNIWSVPPEKSNTIRREAGKHPAIFPQRLAQDHILSWSNPSDLVLDPFLGSGTTARMTLANNRRFIGIEISSEYVEIAKKRIEG
jgi:DNA modification methylase